MNSRRAFVTSALAGIATASLHADGPADDIVDTHTHFYDPTRPQGVPWPGRDDKLLYRRVLPDDFRRIARPLGITGTVVVEASPWVEDNQWLLDLADKDAFLLGIVGRLLPSSDDFARDLRRFARNRKFRGIRINHDELRVALDRDAHFDRLKLLVEHNLELDVNGGPDMPADVARLARRLPDLRIVINHAANVRQEGKDPPRAWQEGMAAAAQRPRVFCKVSALVEATGKRDGTAPGEVAFYRPTLDVLWQRFGEDRLLFGSNWPVSDPAAPLSRVVAIVREYFQAKGREASAKFFRRNAQTAYAWPA
jgi:L-fuconolactonase